MQKNRTGRYVKQLTGYRAYIPKLLPPTPPRMEGMDRTGFNNYH